MQSGLHGILGPTGIGNHRYRPLGVGARTRTAQAKVRDVAITPEDFGAVGNNMTDDTRALQAWANEICRTGGYARMRAGAKYRINAEIVFKPQVKEGNTGSFSPASDIIFTLDKHPVEIDMNGATVIATASMTNMFHFVFNNIAAIDEVAPFFSECNNGRFNGNSLAATGIHTEWTLGFCAKNNRIYGTTVGVECTGFGVHRFEGNYIRATTCFELTDGAGDTIFIHNDLYPTTRAFFIANGSGTEFGQARIFSNACTNEAGGTCYFIEVDGDNNTDVIRNVLVIGNGVAGCDALIKATGSSSAFNLKYWQVIDNNILDFGVKTTIGFIDATELDGWIIRGNTFNPVALTATSIPINVVNATRCIISNNHISKTTKTGLKLAFITKSLITGNIFHTVGEAAGENQVIWLTSSSVKNRVTNNIMDQDNSTPAQRGVLEDGSSSDNRFKDNEFNNIPTPYVIASELTTSGSATTRLLQTVTTANVAAGATVFFGSTGHSATEAFVYWIAPKAGIIRKLYVASSGAPGAAQTFIYTARKSGADQSMTVTVTGAASFGGETIANQFAVVAGDFLSIKLVTSAGAGVTSHRVYMELLETG